VKSDGDYRQTIAVLSCAFGARARSPDADCCLLPAACSPSPARALWAAWLDSPAAGSRLLLPQPLGFGPSDRGIGGRNRGGEKRDSEVDARVRGEVDARVRGEAVRARARERKWACRRRPGEVGFGEWAVAAGGIGAPRPLAGVQGDFGAAAREENR
jgi:hypothetical protein